ncbi:M20 family metallopeptidase [Deferribacterales bacterium RsTz2092]|nr:N-acyl-L-amino acid amidohydrolase [Deferribacterales bacterium]
MLTDDIKRLIDKHYDKAVNIRHTLHRNPEIGHEEFQTSKLIADTLVSLGIETKTGVDKTGVVGLLKGGKPGKTVLLRADMDALRVTEEANVPFKSEREGFMHACGHDGHVAGLLLVAMVLNDLKAQISGNVKLMFQPDEEYAGGADNMIKAGVLDNPKVDIAFAGHLWGNTKEGQVVVQGGPFMAAPDEITIRVIGKGGHGSAPQEAVDPILMAADLLQAFQLIISRNKVPTDPAVLSIGTIHNVGANAFNVIPSEVQMTGSLRTFSEYNRKFIPEAMKRVADGVAMTHGGKCEVEVEPHYPALFNDDGAAAIMKKSVARLIPEKDIITNMPPAMGGEDFAYIAQKVPSCFIFVGISEDMNNPAIHHNPKFQWNDKVLKTLAGCLAQVSVDYLNGN